MIKMKTLTIGDVTYEIVDAGLRDNVVMHKEQTLTEEQKAQARENIGAGTSNAESWNDIKDKPFGEMSTGSDTLYWDGNTEGLESASVAGMTWYKVSDVVPTKDDCVNGVSACLHMSDGSEPQIDVDGGTVQSLFRDDGSFAVEIMILIIPADNYLLVPSMGASVQFQKAGIYFIKSDEGYPSKFTINGYAGF